MSCTLARRSSVAPWSSRSWYLSPIDAHALARSYYSICTDYEINTQSLSTLTVCRASYYWICTDYYISTQSSRTLPVCRAADGRTHACMHRTTEKSLSVASPDSQPVRCVVLLVAGVAHWQLSNPQNNRSQAMVVKSYAWQARPAMHENSASHEPEPTVQDPASVT